MTRRMLTPAGPLDLEDVANDDRVRLWSNGGHPTTVIGAMTVLVSPILPIDPSPGQVARRIVRHGFHAAGLLPDVEGDVGPKPHDKIRAIEVGGALYVDAELGAELTAEAARARDRAWADSARIARERVDLGVIAGMIGVPRVEALREPDYFRTLFRAHLKPTSDAELEKIEPWTGGPQVRIDDEEIRAAIGFDHWRRRAYVAGRLREALVEWKLDEEESGRSR